MMADTVLELRGVEAGYGRTTVLRGVDLTVRPGSVVALLGANGAGKTTLLRTATGLLPAARGRVLVGGRDRTGAPAHRRARDGLCHIPEGRGIFRSLTVRDNLRMQVPPWATDSSVEVALAAFPVLRERLGQTAGTLSGGQQQMLALARAHLARPRIVLLDEVSMGLAPAVVDQIFHSLKALAVSGVALLLVEQYVQRALDIADRVVLLDRGQVTFDGPTGDLDQNALLRGYLGT
nr:MULTISPECIES: ABC transporter ATP-binding protein [unclassified Frankia]